MGAEADGTYGGWYVGGYTGAGAGGTCETGAGGGWYVGGMTGGIEYRGKDVTGGVTDEPNDDTSGEGSADGSAGDDDAFLSGS